MINIAITQGYKFVSERAGIGTEVNWPTFWFVVLGALLLILAIVSAGESE